MYNLLGEEYDYEGVQHSKHSEQRSRGSVFVHEAYRPALRCAVDRAIANPYPDGRDLSAPARAPSRRAYSLGQWALCTHIRSRGSKWKLKLKPCRFTPIAGAANVGPAHRCSMYDSPDLGF